MFEDLRNQNQNQSGQDAPPSLSNLSTSRTIAPPRQGESQPRVEDMFAEVKDAGLPTPPSAAGLANQTTGGKKENPAGNLLKILIIIIVVLAIIFGGLFLASRYLGAAQLSQLNLTGKISDLKSLFIKKAPAPIVNNNQATAPTEKTNEIGENTTNENEEPVSNPVVTPTAPAATTSPAAPAPTEATTASSTDALKNLPAATLQAQDSDHDGLTDYEELNVYFTNPFKADTDNDGLNDYQEVKIYHTNPNNPDTDGDGYLDGAEVQSGYNPLGAGKLK
ncbi:MAG TPA: hypothetical protein VMD74_05150 [Candidatus Methylomirabilis sp.]|nr:hypothetical protein [Candidatus Methylomirabilis sp.]